MIPQRLSDKHIQQAATRIDRDGVHHDRHSVHYDLVINGKRYPPKYVVSLAAYFASGTEYPASGFNAVEAKNYFLGRGYEVIDRRAEAEQIVVSEDDESAFPEGGVRYSRHRQLERDSSITRKAKSKRWIDTGCLECDVCGMDFAKAYGAVGEGFIEAHHIKPVSALDGTEKTRISDLALVCSNCHRMLHRGNPLLSVRQLKKLYRETAVT